MTLKPAAWMCRACGAIFHDKPEPACCQMLDADGSIDMDPLFTRDDLVRVGDKMRAAFILSLDDVVLASVLHTVADDTPDAVALAAEMLGEVENG